MNKRIILWLIHLPVWMVAFSIAYFFGTERFPGSTVSDYVLTTFSYLVWFLGSFYMFYFFLVPVYLEKGKTILFGIYSGLFVLIVPVLLFSLACISRPTPDSFPESFKNLWFLMWLFLGVLTLFCGILGSFYKFGIDWFDNLHLKKELLQSELAMLKSKLNPHFLFNTLNNIDSLIQSAPEKASNAIAQLSDLLRYVVYETENEKIGIQKELEIIKKYMDLELLRISNPEAVSFENLITKDALIPPMLFMPFIENAFKHSNLNHPNQRIAVCFLEDNKEVVFHCVNTIGAQTNDSKENGIGLALVRKRLDLTYPDKYSLDIKQHNNEYIVLLKINISDDSLRYHRRRTFGRR